MSLVSSIFSRPALRKNPRSWLHYVTFERYDVPRVLAGSDKVHRMVPDLKITVRAHYRVAKIGAPAWMADGPTPERFKTESCLWCGKSEALGAVLKEKPNCFGGRLRWVCVDSKACEAEIKRRILLGP